MGARRKIDNITGKEISEKYKEGKSLRVLGKEYGVSTMTIRKYVLENSVETRVDDFARIFKTKEQLNDLVEKWKSGMTQKELKDHFHCGWSGIKTGLRKAGIKAKYSRLERLRLSPNIEQKIENLWAEGTDAQTIAKIMKLDRATLCRWLENHGYKVEARRPTGPKSSGWRGGRRIDKNGYILITLEKKDPYLPFMAMKNGQCFEHRYIMAKYLERPLSRYETVHHINCLRNDNRISNLQLRHGNHGVGGIFQCQDCGSLNISAIPLSETP